MKKYFFIMVLLVSVIFLGEDFRNIFQKSGTKLGFYLASKIGDSVVGILPFEGNDKEKSTLVSDIYSYYLMENNIKIVDRKELEKVIKEIKLSMLGITDIKNSNKLGNLISADYLLTGNIKKLGDIYYINIKVIKVSTGESIYTDSINFEDKEFITIKKVEEYFAERKYPSTALFRSALIPGWGQMYNDQPIKGGIFGISMIGSISLDLYFFNEYQKYLNSTNEEMYDKDLKKANDYNKYFLISFGTTIAIWIINMADAYINAK
ncbi:hypothetical protein OSSY52_12680 [Tepiditoga spiralis]|uniref:DUF5683 domain-containing protein n=1 Tax=Tepiditoga spiralis TaxID=2108365 RepID=A0A7G1G855_9BACT|nr:DUF5683 domain-containing protein [Tepiditoga spiralis]BBE31127.1 hypothetical protein OSSY52_12680 [Tepiditoga spiralis]